MVSVSAELKHPLSYKRSSADVRFEFVVQTSETVYTSAAVGTYHECHQSYDAFRRALKTHLFHAAFRF